MYIIIHWGQIYIKSYNTCEYTNIIPQTQGWKGNIFWIVILGRKPWPWINEMDVEWVVHNVETLAIVAKNSEKQSKNNYTSDQSVVTMARGWLD